MPKNWEQRDKKLQKKKTGMRVSNRSIFVVQESEAKRNRRKVEKGKKDAD